MGNIHGFSFPSQFRIIIFETKCQLAGSAGLESHLSPLTWRCEPYSYFGPHRLGLALFRLNKRRPGIRFHSWVSVSALANSIKLHGPLCPSSATLWNIANTFFRPLRGGRKESRMDGGCVGWRVEGHAPPSDGDAAHRWWHVLWLAFQLSCGDMATI